MASKYLQKYPIPQGFNDIVHNLTREILRDQPEDIIEYAALYFEALRDNRPFTWESKYNVQGDKSQPSHYQPKAFNQKGSEKQVETKSAHSISDSEDKPKVKETERSEDEEERQSGERSVKSQSSGRGYETDLAKEYIQNLEEDLVQKVISPKNTHSDGDHESQKSENENQS